MTQLYRSNPNQDSICRKFREIGNICMLMVLLQKKISVKTRPIVGGKKMQEILGKFMPLQFDEIFSANGLCFKPSFSQNIVVL